MFSWLDFFCDVGFCGSRARLGIRGCLRALMLPSVDYPASYVRLGDAVVVTICC